MPFCTKRHRRQVGAALLSAALSFSALTACDPPGELGLQVLPDDVPASATYVAYAGTAATVLRNDSVLTANKGNALVGHLRDTQVGTTTAESYWQVSPLTTNPSAPLVAGAQADSLVLTFGFNSFYGTPDGRQVLEAYQLARGFSDDTAYYGNSKPIKVGARLGETSFRLRYRWVKTDPVLAFPWIIGNDSLRKDSVQVLQPLRIKVDPTTSTLRADLFSKIGSSELASLANLQAILKGIVLRPKDNTTGAIVNVLPSSSNTRLTLYYRLPTDSAKQAPRQFVFSLGNVGTERHFTRLTTDFRTGDKLTRFDGALDTVTLAATAPDFTAYLQGGVELVTRIKLEKKLEELRAKRGNIVINRAELVVPVRQYAAGVYPVPSQAFLVQVDSLNRPLKTSGVLRTVQANGNDPTATNAPAVVTYDATARAYRVQLTTYLDAYVNDKLTDRRAKAFWLVPSLPALNSLGLNRALIDAAPNQIQLRVYYSEIN